MLTIAGLGLCDEKDLTLKALEECKRANKVYVELYTNLWQGNLQRLEKLIGKEIFKLKREDIEQGYERILEEAKHDKIVILVPGDPFIATTHSFLLKEAKLRGIEFRVIHNASIASAIAKTGLHIYKFGGVVTIPLSSRIPHPNSIIEKIKTNKKLGLHTLCLLDIDVEYNKYLTVREALLFLKKKVLNEEDKIVVLSKIGCEDEKIVYGKVDSLIKEEFELPACIIVPSTLHFSEEEILKLYEIST